nr:DUF1612 domain-containing protein [Rhizobium mongolense]
MTSILLPFFGAVVMWRQRSGSSIVFLLPCCRLQVSPRHRKRSTHTFTRPILCIRLESRSRNGALRQAENLPPVLQVIVALDAWNELGVLQRAPWVGWLLAASILRMSQQQLLYSGSNRSGAAANHFR